jgi:putative addiction module component (TIGR02574 family)
MFSGDLSCWGDCWMDFHWSNDVILERLDAIPPQLLQTALALPEGARADLAAELIASLDPTVDADYDAAWDAEIKLRVEQLDAGAVQCIPWEAVRAELLGERRAS